MGAAPEPQTGNKMELHCSSSPALPPRHFLRHWLRAFAAKVSSVAGVLLRPLGPRERHCGGRRLPVELLHETVHWAPFEQCARLAFGAGCAPLAALADARHKKLAALKMAAVLRRKRGERELLLTRFGGLDKHAQCWCRPAGVKPSPMEMAVNEFRYDWTKIWSPSTIGRYESRLPTIGGEINFLAFGNFEASGYFNTGGQCRVQCPLTLVTASAHSIAFWECREPKIWHALAVLPVEAKLGVKYDRNYAEIRWKRKSVIGQDGWHETGDVQRRRLWTQVRFRPLLRNDFNALLALFQTQLAVPKISHCNEAEFGDPLLLPPVHVHRNYALEDDVIPYLQQHPSTSQAQSSAPHLQLHPSTSQAQSSAPHLQLHPSTSYAQSSAPHLQLHPSTSQAQSSAAGGGLPAIGGGQIQPDGYDGKVLYEVVVVPSDATAVHFSKTKMKSAAPSTRQCGEKGATEEEEDQWHDALTDVPGPLRGLVTGAAGQIGYSLNSKSEQTTKKQNESVTSPSAASTAKSPSEDTTPFHRVDSGDKKLKEGEATTSFHCAAATPPTQQVSLEPAPAHVLEEAPPSPPTAPKLEEKDHQQSDEQKMEEQSKSVEEEAKAEEVKNEGKKDEEKSAEGKDEIAEAKKGEKTEGEVDVEQDGKSAEEEKAAEEQNE